ncbi:hypothetical protein H4W32_007582 [Actinophytocola algeriensis]|uniref:ABC-2 type transporter transmembrane domain-containing protein n=1 Tax=Actinophytocola algeriensis TaxID=1768010 RepID=A0A7W7Q5P0_9PSEU|nr:hypothetical protein [Actinophytocola algeriensis]MBE1479540.1 hypothetical protein [Actinophytocola algeriensis]
MTTLTDSATMLRRNLRHAIRYPSLTFGVALVPVIMLLMFAYLFGNAISIGVASTTEGADYIDFLVPGILLMTLGSGSQTTAVQICGDMAEGIVARFRTMPITRTSVLTGQVAGSVILTMVSSVLTVGVGLAMGFRPTAGPVEWLAVLGLMLLATFAITWLAVGFGLASKAPEGASNAAMPLSFFLPLPVHGLRPAGVAAGRHPLVRRVPAVHADHRDAARVAGRRADRAQRLAGRRVVRRARDRRLPVVEEAVQPRPEPVGRAASAASAAPRSSDRSRPAYSDTASAYAGLSACSAAAPTFAADIAG